jgi:tetratricopeptide (TPR) repeat protein
MRSEAAAILCAALCITLILGCRGTKPSGPTEKTPSAEISRQVNELIAAGDACRTREDFTCALDAYTKAVSLDPSNYLPYYKRGSTYFYMGKYTEAKTDYDKVVSLVPSFPNVYSSRGAVYVKIGKYDEAIRDCDKAISLAPTFRVAYVNRGDAFAGLGRTKEAREDYKKACDLGDKKGCDRLTKLTGK